VVWGPVVWIPKGSPQMKGSVTEGYPKNPKPPTQTTNSPLADIFFQQQNNKKLFPTTKQKKTDSQPCQFKATSISTNAYQSYQLVFNHFSKICGKLKNSPTWI